VPFLDDENFLGAWELGAQTCFASVDSGRKGFWCASLLVGDDSYTPIL
jgi:hypothetical protein